MAPTPPDISVVVVSWNTIEPLRRALDCVAAASSPLGHEIIVVDNGSEDGSPEWLRCRPGVRLVALDTNTGFTRAANAGARLASGRYLLLLNPDVTAPPGAFARLADALDSHPEAWGAVPWFRNPDGSAQYFWRRMTDLPTVALCFTRWGRVIDRALGNPLLRRRRYGELADPPGLVAIEGVGAACLLLHRAEFVDTGGFDERYFNFFQDGAFERDMLRRGRVLLGVGDVEVTHETGVSLRRLPGWEVDGQFLLALRQFLAGEPRWRRWLGEAAVRADLWLPGPDSASRRRRALGRGEPAGGL